MDGGRSKAIGITVALIVATLLWTARPASAETTHYLPSDTVQNVTYYGSFLTDEHRCDFSFAYGNFAGVAFARVKLISDGCGGALVEVYGVVNDGGCCAWRYSETTGSGQAALRPFSRIVHARWAIVTDGFLPEALCFSYNPFTGALHSVDYGGIIPAECR